MLIPGFEVADVINVLLGSGILITCGRYATARIKKNDDRTEAVRYGVQALLRDRLYEQYDKYYERGYAPVWVKQNFENMYKRYHNLGDNGVMDQHYEDFMSLPDKKKEESDD